MLIDAEEYAERLEKAKAEGKFELGSGEATRECAECSDAAVFVSANGVPACGPLPFDDMTTCETDDGVYYHRAE